jgi:thiol-disulfide isomerase/thioredoxin
MSKSNLLILFILLMPLRVEAEQPDFFLPDLSGKMHHLSDYRGKWVVVNYWATWCPPCLEEIPELVDFHNAHHTRDAIVVGINYEDSEPADLKSFVAEYMISYPILRANLTRPPVFGRLLGLPTTFIVSPSGQLVQTRTGSITKEFLEDAIKQLSKPDVVVKK